MNTQFNIVKIKIQTGSGHPDRVILVTDIFDPCHDEEKLELTFTTPRGAAKGYVESHFPLVRDIRITHD